MKFKVGGSTRSILGGRTNNRNHGGGFLSRMLSASRTFLSRLMSQSKTVRMVVIGGCLFLTWKLFRSEKTQPRIVPKDGYVAFPPIGNLPTPTSGGGGTSSSSTLPMITFPKSTKSIIMNIGTNNDPILPAVRAGPCSKVLAFEPMVPDSIQAHPQIMVIPAAISNVTGLSVMEKYNNGLSSSLSAPTSKGKWVYSNSGGEKSKRLVPTYTLTEVLQAIPQRIQINLIFTDMQGYDFVAIQASINALRERQVPYLYTEVTVENIQSYEGVPSDLCRDWIPFMLQNGYEYAGALNGVLNIDNWYETALSILGYTSNPYDDPQNIQEICQQEMQRHSQVSRGAKETNAFWRLKDLNPIAYQDKTAIQQLNEMVHPSSWTGGSKVFTQKEYDSCD